VQFVAAQDVGVGLRCGEHHHGDGVQVGVGLELAENFQGAAPGQVRSSKTPVLRSMVAAAYLTDIDTSRAFYELPSSHEHCWPRFGTKAALLIWGAERPDQAVMGVLLWARPSAMGGSAAGRADAADWLGGRPG
jgi:hypothetical protein